MRRSHRANNVQEGEAGLAATCPVLAAAAGPSSLAARRLPEKRPAAHIEGNDERQVNGGDDEAADSPDAGAIAPRMPVWCSVSDHRQGHREQWREKESQTRGENQGGVELWGKRESENEEKAEY